VIEKIAEIRTRGSGVLGFREQLDSNGGATLLLLEIALGDRTSFGERNRRSKGRAEWQAFLHDREAAGFSARQSFFHALLPVTSCHLLACRRLREDNRSKRRTTNRQVNLHEKSLNSNHLRLFPNRRGLTVIFNPHRVKGCGTSPRRMSLELQRVLVHQLPASAMHRKGLAVLRLRPILDLPGLTYPVRHTRVNY
jgi:hypothetical protein